MGDYRGHQSAAMEQAAVGLRGGVAKIQDRQLSTMLMSISDNYQVKLLAAKALVRAVETSNAEAQSASSEQLRAAGLAGRNLALDLKDLVEASPRFANACPKPGSSIGLAPERPPLVTDAIILTAVANLTPSEIQALTPR